MNFPLAFRPPVIAHRGARAKAPENTLAAIRQAHEDGATWFETDVKLMRDGVPILMHDDTLEYTTSGTGNVADMDWAEMQTLDAGSWFGADFKDQRIPQLADALRYAAESRMRVNLEIKPCPGRTRATAMVTLIEAAKLWPIDAPPPLISSFDIEALIVAAGLHPEWPRGLLLEKWREDWQDIAQKTKANTIHLDERELTQKRMDRFAQARMPVLAYTVNDVVRAKELLRWGAKAVFSDDPGKLIPAL
jgi:glycerophosphoryl diester phosphodiesterase